MLLALRPDLTATDPWLPIRRIGRPRIDAAASELFNVRVTLAGTPSSDWREAFIQFENGVERVEVHVHESVLGGQRALVVWRSGEGRRVPAQAD